jgi:hypothetical protein
MISNGCAHEVSTALCVSMLIVDLQLVCAAACKCWGLEITDPHGMEGKGSGPCLGTLPIRTTMIGRLRGPAGTAKLKTPARIGSPGIRPASQWP